MEASGGSWASDTCYAHFKGLRLESSSDSAKIGWRVSRLGSEPRQPPTPCPAREQEGPSTPCVPTTSRPLPPVASCPVFRLIPPAGPARAHP